MSATRDDGTECWCDHGITCDYHVDRAVAAARAEARREGIEETARAVMTALVSAGLDLCLGDRERGHLWTKVQAAIQQPAATTGAQAGEEKVCPCCASESDPDGCTCPEWCPNA